MTELRNIPINHIVNNFDENSKLFIELIESNKNNLTVYSINKNKDITLYNSSSPIERPYYANLARIVLSILFNMSGIDKIVLKVNNETYNLDKKSISLLIGYIESIKEPHSTVENAVSNSKFHLAHYLTTIQQSLPQTISIVYMMLGFYDDAIKKLEGLEDEESLLLMSKNFRAIGNIKKSLEILSSIKSKELEVDRNIEYGWLHYLSKNFENSYKIFNYYSSINNEKKGEVLYALALSMIERDEDPLKIIEILKSALAVENIYKIKTYEQLAKLYIEIKDYIKAYEIYKKVYSLIPSLESLYQISYCNFALQRDSIAIANAIECGVFDIDKLERLLENRKIDSNKIKYPDTFFLITTQRERNEENVVVEASLKPQDISEISRSKLISESIKEGFKDEKWVYQRQENISNLKDKIAEEAFEFSKLLEEEFNKKIYFNYEGLEDVERKIRLTFITETNVFEKTSIIKGACAFLLFFLQERFKAKIIKYEDLDIWAWPSIVKNKNGLEIITYPGARIWEISWTNVLPPQGWLKNYVQYLTEFINCDEDFVYGKEAIIKKVRSHNERIFDAKIEHKKILLISQDLQETYHIPHNISALTKLEKEIKTRYKPHIPPTTDGWKILRCYAHIFLEMLIKEFDLLWYNVEKNDGLWSFILYTNTYIFPIGKVYKSVSANESLIEYYETLRRNFPKR